MLKGKKVVVITTTDNMIWQFLIPHIKRLQELGNEVECVCAKTGFWFDELKDKYGFVVHDIQFTRNPISIRNIKGFKELVKLQKEKQYNLVYCQQPVGGVMGRKLAKKFKLPCIYTAHGFHFFKGNNFLKNFIFKTIEKHYSRYTTALVTINEEDYLASQKFYAKKTYKINGIGFDNKKYTIPIKSREETRKELGLQQDDFVVCTVAEFIKRKNYETMLKTLCNLDKDIKLVSCGRGVLLEEIKEKAKALGLENRILFLGYRNDVNSIMNMSDMYFLPSYQEGLTLSIIEAMSFGLPVVTSNVRGNRDLIENNKGGFICEPNDVDGFAKAITKLSTSPELSQQFGDFNKTASVNYSIQKVIEQLDKVYEEME